MNYKKIFVFLLAYLFAIAYMPINTNAQQDMMIEGGVLQYYFGSAKNVVVPSHVTSIKSSAFTRNMNMTSIDIPFSVTKIESGVFEGCYNLKYINIDSQNKVFIFQDGALINTETHEIIAFLPTHQTNSYTMPDSIETIGTYSFAGCKNLSEITISKNVSSIGEFAFIDCANLKNINVASDNINISSMDGVLFNKEQTKILKFPAAKEQKSFTIPKHVTSIGEFAFFQCARLTNVTLHEAITEIEKGAFGDCTGLESIDIPPSVTKIKYVVFSGCSNLKSIDIGKSVISIDSDSFNGCSNLKAINVNEKNTIYQSLEGVLYTKGQKSLLIYPVGKVSENYIVLEGTTSIGNRAFLECKGLKNIQFPNSLKSIGAGAFYGCHGLTSITIPNSVTKIGYIAFDDCPNIVKATIPKSVTEIGNLAFNYHTNLTIYTDSYYIKTYADVHSYKVIYEETPKSKIVVKAQPLTANVYINNELVSIPAYNIDGSNYFKLRDIAYAVKDTNKKFDVQKNGLTFFPNQPYRPVGVEMQPFDNQNPVMASKICSYIHDDAYKAATTAYEIDRDTFFQIRYIATQVDFYVSYNAETNSIYIDTAKTFEN